MNFTFVATIASLGGLLFGYDTGVISGALLQLRTLFHLSSTGQDLVTAVVLVGATAGAGCAGWLADRHGRRRVILAVAALFVLGAIVSAAAWSLAMLIGGRLIVGAAIGVASMLVPLYLAELAPAVRRGRTVSLNQFCITAGILLSYLVDYLFSDSAGGWRWMLGLGGVPGMLMGVGMLVLPESPRWLAAQGRMEAAADALRRVRPHTDIAAELAGLRDDDAAAAAPWSAILRPGARRPLVIGVVLAIAQQVTGINTVIYYAPTIFQSSGFSSASVAILATAGIGVVNVGMTVVAMRLLDGVGRRRLLLGGLGGMAVSLAVLATAFGMGGRALGPITALSLAVYVGSFAIGLGPVFWLLISEIFPLAVRGRGMSIAALSNWGANFLVTLVFLDLIRLIGSAGVFWLFALLTVASIAFTWAMVPETAGRSLEQIEASLDGDRRRARQRA